jgi:hypothetical protein
MNVFAGASSRALIFSFAALTVSRLILKRILFRMPGARDSEVGSRETGADTVPPDHICTMVAARRGLAEAKLFEFRDLDRPHSSVTY